MRRARPLLRRQLSNGEWPTNGGQLSAGQAGAAGGYQNVTEALRQAIKQPLGHQIPNSSIGLISGFGMVNYDRGVCTGAVVIEADNIR